MLDTKLIENTLALTGKTMEDMEVIVINGPNTAYLENEFSIEKFCYYLLSPEFIEKYSEIEYIFYSEYSDNKKQKARNSLGPIIGSMIQSFQEGDKKPLIQSLQKIPPGTKHSK